MKWIEAVKSKPPITELVLVRSATGYITSDWYNGTGFEYTDDVTHWMPWPAQPDEMMTLAGKMKRWAELRTELDELEAQIREEVMALGRSQTVGNVHATYTSGRGSYNYEAIAAELGAPEDIVKRHTKPMTDWRKVVDELKAPDELRAKYYTPGTPSVTLKIRHET